MAITSSAKKAIRVSLRRRVFNLRRMNAVRKVTKNIRKLVSDKKMSEAEALLPQAYKAIDKAAKMNTFSKSAAARKKSRLAMLIKKST